MIENNNNLQNNLGIKSGHRNDIDSLRVFATILIIYFHTASLFNAYSAFFIQNDELSNALGIFVFFCFIWHMELFFLLAGISTYYSLNFRTKNHYAMERFRRLCLPLIFGILIVTPPVFYIMAISWWCNTRYSSFNFDGSYYEFYPILFYVIRDPNNISAFLQHLWFLLYLFFISLVTLPLLLKVKNKETVKQQVSSIVNYFEKGRKIFLFSLPLMVINVSLRWIFPHSYMFFNDWAQFLFFLTIFIFGFLIVADTRLENSIARNKTIALVLAVITTFFVILMILSSMSASNTSSTTNTNANPIGYFIGYTIFWALFSFCAWCWLITIFGYGHKYLNKPNALIRHLSEMSLPIYILHNLIIVIIGFYVLQWEGSILIKFLIISTSALFITIFLCELVKTNNITRFIFGMRLKENKK